MKLKITQLRCKHNNTYSKGKCEDIVTYKVHIKLARFDYPQDYTVYGLLWDYCIFISSECNVLIAIFSLVIVVITVI